MCASLATLLPPWDSLPSAEPEFFTTDFVTVQLLPAGVLRYERQAPLKYSQSAKEVPITRPRPNVIPAASNPKRTCRKPEYSTPRPVSNEIPAPIPNRANAAKT